MNEPLSPAAQAVMVAATNGNFNVVNDPVYKQCIAAALVAAADQVVPEPNDTDKALLALAAIRNHCKVRDKFLAIAAELQGQ
jgi:hypothetical protein